MVNLVIKVLLATKGLPVPKGHKVTLVILVHKVHRVLAVILVHKVPKVILALKALKGHLVQKQ